MDAGLDLPLARSAALWTPEQVASSAERFFPLSLAAVLPQVLAGVRVDEPFDHWD